LPGFGAGVTPGEWGREGDSVNKAEMTHVAKNSRESKTEMIHWKSWRGDRTTVYTGQPTGYDVDRTWDKKSVFQSTLRKHRKSAGVTHLRGKSRKQKEFDA